MQKDKEWDERTGQIMFGPSVPASWVSHSEQYGEARGEGARAAECHRD